MRHRHDNGASVGAPGRRGRAAARIGRDDPHGLRRDIDENDLGSGAEPMTLDGNHLAVGRPSRRVELRLRFGHQQFDLRTGVSAEIANQHQITQPRPALHGDERRAIRRQIRIEKARLGRQPPHVSGGARPLVEIAVDAGVAAQIFLVEVDRVSADGCRRSKNTRRQAMNTGAIEPDAIQRRKRVRRS